MEKPKCCRCDIYLEFVGQIPFRTGGMKGGWEMLLGAFADIDEDLVKFDIFKCFKCGKLEFFDPDFNYST
jgi:hypothetical protein